MKVCKMTIYISHVLLTHLCEIKQYFWHASGRNSNRRWTLRRRKGPFVTQICYWPKGQDSVVQRPIKAFSNIGGSWTKTYVLTLGNFEIACYISCETSMPLYDGVGWVGSGRSLFELLAWLLKISCIFPYKQIIKLMAKT